ncbi:sulfatase [Seonamhaeicola maritimus]|uniref:sulfatase n=1 Tax=Seonamhaeicola maritimus TaxID=2591822 RepID=UPI00249526EC|nr:sulfatase [Seonamhaeicola maritimus]
MRLLNIVFAFVVIVSCKTQPNQPSLNQNPNVLFIMVDDLNDYQGVFGGHPQAKTPNINKLAKSGTMFINGHTNVPVCSPSRNSLMTGIYPHNSRDFGWTPHYKHAVLKNHKTFVELFKENGYRTYGTGKLLHKNVKSYWDEWGVPEGINYGPHAYSGIDENGKRIMGHSSVPEPFRSINVVDGSFASFADTPVRIDHSGNKIKTGWTYGKKAYNYIDDNNRDLLPDEQHAEWIGKKIKALEKSDDSLPFFMGVGFVNPHTPLYAPQKYFDMFPLDKIKMPVMKENDKDDIHYASAYETTEMGIAYYKKLRQSFPNGDEGLRKFLQAYLACVTFVDDQIGKVVEALDNSNFKHNTIVVLVSDHGWQMGEKDYLYKNSPWDESTRIPFIIRDPQKSKPGSKVEHAVSLIDIFPTFKDLCNLKGNITKDLTQSQLDGFSLRPFLEDSNTTNWDGPEGALTVLGAGINKPIEGLGFSSNPSALWHIEITKDLDTSYVRQQNYSYRTKDWRYILYRNGKEELYNHKDDSYEWHNLAVDSKHEIIKAKLRNEMEEIIH